VKTFIHRRAGEVFDDIVNHSIVQTLPRSINTQLTSVFTLTALVLFGGILICNSVLILLIGLISGTYSSIFNASRLLVVWEHQEWRNWLSPRVISRSLSMADGRCLTNSHGTNEEVGHPHLLFSSLSHFHQRSTPCFSGSKTVSHKAPQWNNKQNPSS
jgi:hypothetical protein